MLSSLPPFPSFNVDSDKTTVGVRWTKWLDKIENFMTAFNITDEGRKKAMLLHFAGDDVFDIASTIDTTPRAADGNNGVAVETVYAATKKALNQYFCPTQNKEYNIYVFRQTK